MEFTIFDIQITNLIIIFSIYLILMVAFICKKRDTELRNFIVVFFDTILLIGGFNVFYFAFTKQTLFEELPTQSLDLLIALAGLLMIVLGIKKIHETFK